MKLPPVEFNDWGDVFLAVLAVSLATVIVCSSAIVAVATVKLLFF